MLQFLINSLTGGNQVTKGSLLLAGNNLKTLKTYRMKKLNFTILMLTLVISLHAQSEFEKTYDFYTRATADVLFTQNDGYLIVHQNRLDKAYLSLIKTDFKGDTLWTKNHDIGTLQGFFTWGTSDENGNLFITCDGSKQVIKMNPLGEIIWSKSFPRLGKKLLQYYNNKLWMAVEGTYLYKIDPQNGDSLWRSSMISESTNLHTFPTAMTIMPNEDIILAVSFLDLMLGYSSNMLFRCNEITNAIPLSLQPYQKVFLRDMKVVAGQIWAVGNSFSSPWSMNDGLLFIKFTSEGNVISSNDKKFTNSRYFTNFIINADGNIVSLGESSEVHPKLYLYCMSSNFDSLWTREFAGSDYYGQQLKLANDNGYVISGWIESNNIITPFLKKTNSLGLILTLDDRIYHNDINVYPNPASDVITFTTKGLDNGNLKLYNSIGKPVLQRKITGNKITVNASTFVKGVYYYSIETEKGVHSGKIFIN